MIEIYNVTKCFDTIKAVDEVSVTIRENTVFGLIGTNGAGKSTVLRMITGVLKPDEGTIAVDNMPVYDNVDAKKKCFSLPTNRIFLQTDAHRQWNIITAESMRILIRKSFINIWRILTWISAGRSILFQKE